MAYQLVSIDESIANVLPSGPAGAALSCGELVYMDSSGNWQKAQSVVWLAYSVTRKDAIGVVTRDYLQYERCNPVKVARFRGFTSLTVGAECYLSAATAGASTQTCPSKVQVRQLVGFAATATEVQFDVGRVAAKAQYDGGSNELVFSGTADGTGVAQYDLCGLTSAGLITKALAAAGATQVVAIGMALVAISASAAGTLHNMATIVTTGQTAGTPIWLHVSSAGSFQTSVPSTTGQLIQKVGIVSGAIGIVADVQRYGLARSA